MSRTDFLTSPQAWTRTKNIDQSPAQYACSIERTSGHETHGDIAVKWAVRFGFVFVVCLLVLERLA
jgi:hypothetical protein